MITPERLWMSAFLHFANLLALASAGASVLAAEPREQLQPLPVANVEIRDSFWEPKLKVCRERTIPHAWQYMQWEIRSLRRAAGQKVDGELNNTWGEANLYKFLETAAYSLAVHRDAELEHRLDEVIAMLARVQRPDGYLHVFVTNNSKQPWDPDFLDGSHDGYVLGHLIEAALAHYAATGRRSLLDIACKAADQACDHFLGPNGHPGFCGHAELEMAMVELHRVTHQRRYLELARAFVEWRGRGKVKPFSATPRAYFQDAVPLRDQRTLEGHAVRAVFFATGVADLALATGETDYRLASHRFWDSTTLRRMTITGSVGPRKEHEAFGEDYELPNDGYYESCAACGLVNFAQRMFLLERRAESCDVMERVLYNAVLHGISLDGTSTYYCNPLSDHDHLRDNCWVCCPPNLSRTLMQVGRYAYAWSPRDLYVNLFVGGAVRVPLEGGEVTLHAQTDYPWNGRMTFRVQTKSPRRLAIHVRRPGWCTKSQGTLNDAPVDIATDDAGYWVFDRPWNDGDRVGLTLDMPVRRMVAHPNIASCRDKVTLQRGPLVYGFEGIDNHLSPIVLGADPRFQVDHRPDMLGGVTTIRGVAASGQPLLAVPFYSLANRGKSAQEVWVTQQGLQASSDWWLGALYRAMPNEGEPVSPDQGKASAPASEQLRVEWPVDRAIVQRSPSNMGAVRISGKCPARADRIEARLTPCAAGQGIPTGWTAIEPRPHSGKFTGAILGNGGWYCLEVRAMADNSVLAQAVVPHVGIGEVFVVVGHSVAAGQKENIDGAADDRVNTVPLDKESRSYQDYLQTGDWHHLPEPRFVHYGSGVIPAPFGSGNYFWAKFGEHVARKQNVPVLIFNAAFGGTSLEHWAKSAKQIRFEHGFVKSSIRMPYINLFNTLRKYVPETGLRAVLADQGQNDWPEKDEELVFRNYLAWVEQARTDLGHPELAIVVNRQTPFLRDAQIRRVQDRMIRTPNCFAGPDYDTLPKDSRPDTIHLGLAGQSAAARLWAESLEDRFFQSSKPWLPASTPPGQAP